MNKVLLIGNLTKDPSISSCSDGTSLCKFSLAVDRKSGNDETDFFNIVAWRTLAENCAKYLKKGSKAAVFGSIQIRSYDSDDGSKRFFTEIVADDVQFLSSINGGNSSDKPSDDKKEG